MLHSHYSKSSFFFQKFPLKLSIFLGKKLVKMLWFWTFQLLTTLISRKNCQKFFSEKLVKMLEFCQYFDRACRLKTILVLFCTIFLVKSKLSTAKRSKTTTFSRVFHPKPTCNFSRETKVEFLHKK